MRFSQLARRNAFIGIVAAMFMVGMLVGRVSINHSWVEGFCTLLYIGNGVIWFLPLHFEAQREDRKFREAMRKLEEEMRR
jgi:hypothetical protein